MHSIERSVVASEKTTCHDEDDDPIGFLKKGETGGGSEHPLEVGRKQIGSFPRRVWPRGKIAKFPQVPGLLFFPRKEARRRKGQREEAGKTPLCRNQ